MAADAAGIAGRAPRLALLGLALLGLASCSSPTSEGVYKVGRPYQIGGRWYHPVYDPDYDEIGIASWYGADFHGRSTANGEVFDRKRVSAAHPTLPLPSIVRVTNLANDRQIEVRVNDRGPFVGDRVIDLSQAAARELGFERRGTTPVRVQFVRLAEAKGKPPQPTARRARAPRDAFASARPTLIGAAAEACQGHFIQVAAFGEPDRARRLAARLDELAVMPVKTEAPGIDRLTRVRLGPIGDPDEAQVMVRRLRQMGYSGAFVLQPVAPMAVGC